METMGAVNLKPDKARKPNGKVWWIVLGVLLAVIVALVVAVVVVNVNMNGNGGASEPGEEGTYPTSLHTEAMEKLNEAAAEVPLNDAMVLYEEAIEGADNEVKRSEARVEYGRYLLGFNMTEEAFAQFDLVDIEALNASYKMLLFAAYRDFYGDNYNEELYETYNDMIREVVENSDLAAGGGA